MVAARLNKDEIDAHLDALSRQPFRDALSQFLQAAPDSSELMDWAREKPDRWAQSLAIVARLSGYTDTLQVEGTVQHVHELSDAELLAQVEAYRGRVIEGETSEDAGSNPCPDATSDGE